MSGFGKSGHLGDSNKFTQWKQGGYYINGTVLSYIKLFLK